MNQDDSLLVKNNSIEPREQLPATKNSYQHYRDPLTLNNHQQHRNRPEMIKKYIFLRIQ